MNLVVLSLLANVATAADLNADGCEDSYFDANGACVSPNATVGSGSTVGASSEIRDYAAVGADTAIGASVVIGERVSIAGRVSASGARPIGTGTTMGRRTSVGADHSIGQDNLFGRGVDAGERLVTADDVSLGFGVQLGDDVTLGTDAAVGSLVTLGNNTSVAANTVIARGAVIADSASTASIAGIIGPDVTIGGNATISDTSRIRKGAQLGSDVTVLGGARIGRDVVIGDGATIGSNVRLAAGVTVTDNTLVPDDAVVLRGETYDDPQATGCIAPWLPVQNQGGLSDGVGIGTNWSIAGSSVNTNGAVLTQDFNGDFEVVARWASPYTGIGIVHGSNVTYQDVDGSAASAYWNALANTGFPHGYAGTYKGLYSVAGNTSVAYHYRWLRQGGTVRIQSSTNGVNGPWSEIGSSPYNVPTSHTVVVGIGEGWGNNTSSMLELVSCTN